MNETIDIEQLEKRISEEPTVGGSPFVPFPWQDDDNNPWYIEWSKYGDVFEEVQRDANSASNYIIAYNKFRNLILKQQEVSKEELKWAYIAGVFESNGRFVQTNIKTKYGNRVPQSYIEIRNKSLTETLKELIGFGKIVVYHTRESSALIIAVREEVLFFCNNILPFLNIKKEIIEEAIKVTELSAGKPVFSYKRLSSEQKEQICNDYKSGVTISSLAAKYQTSMFAIARCVKDIVV